MNPSRPFGDGAKSVRTRARLPGSWITIQSLNQRAKIVKRVRSSTEVEVLATVRYLVQFEDGSTGEFPWWDVV